MQGNQTHAFLCERKEAVAQIGAISDDGIIEGYAAVFDVEDKSGDIFAPGAFRQSLADKGPAGIKLLYQHNPSEPIGRWLDLHEDGKGLFARGELIPNVSRSQDVLTLIRAGILDGLSIGFNAVKARTDRATGIRTIFEIDLWEISIVTFPMHPQARLNAQKSDTDLAQTIRRAARVIEPKRNPYWDFEF